MRSYQIDFSFFVGVLVDAMRRGHWIILDELNLAPSDVLEALNRVLYLVIVLSLISVRLRFFLRLILEGLMNS